MGKTPVNTALGTVSGRIDDWVYRRTLRGVVVARRPRPGPPVEPTAAELEVQNRWKAAAKYARTVMQSPAKKESYVAQAKEEKLSVWSLAMRDYLTPPAVDQIDLAAYHGQTGQVIKVLASDDVAVTEVKVVLRRLDNLEVEQGLAVLTAGEWLYTATTTVPPDTGLFVEATAQDRACNTHARTERYG